MHNSRKKKYRYGTFFKSHMLWIVLVIFIAFFVMLEIKQYRGRDRGSIISARNSVEFSIQDVITQGVPILPGMTALESYLHLLTTPTAAGLVAEDMQKGWNLGNTLDSVGDKGVFVDETYWNNPYTSYSMLVSVHKAGFQVVRIPVTYYNHMDENGNIEEAWLDRVEQVVQYVLENDMYCIIDTHWDSKWIVLDGDTFEDSRQQFAKLWQQVAYRFQDYDEHLLFEGFNELRDSQGHYNSVDEECLAKVNELNQTFVDTVRSTGGYNQVRYLVVTPYTAHVLPRILKAFQLPEDTIAGRLLVDVHTYTEMEGLEEVFHSIEKYLCNRKMPVLIGEFGMRADEYTTDERVAYIERFRQHADELQVGYLWWDSGGKAIDKTDVNAFAILNRNDCTWYFPEIADALTK